jgi:hypothetical protein
MRKLIATFLLLSLTSLSAFAQETEEEANPQNDAATSESEEQTSTDREWKTTFTPMLWLANTDTTITFGDRSRGVTLKASDALGSLESAGTFRLAVNNGKWGGFADLYFVGLGDTTQIGPNGNIPLRATVDNVLWQVAGTYRAVDKENFNLDVLAGLRGYSLDLGVTVQPFTGPAGQVQFPGRALDKGISFVDPVIGGMAKFDLSDKWGLDFYGDIGGFGVGSDFTYRLGTGIDYSFNKSVAVRAGYTVIDYKYSTGSGLDLLEYDTTMYGPNLGMSFTF